LSALTSIAPPVDGLMIVAVGPSMRIERSSTDFAGSLALRGLPRLPLLSRQPCSPLYGRNAIVSWLGV